MFGYGPERRVRKRSEYLRAQRCGVAAHSRHLVLLVFVRDDRQPSRLGVVASKKVGSAVVRNRGKRKIREWFRTRGDDLPRGVDLVVILKRGGPDLTVEALAQQFDRVLPRLCAKARQAFAAARDCTPLDQAAPMAREGTAVIIGSPS